MDPFSSLAPGRTLPSWATTHYRETSSPSVGTHHGLPRRRLLKIGVQGPLRTYPHGLTQTSCSGHWDEHPVTKCCTRFECPYLHQWTTPCTESGSENAEVFTVTSIGGGRTEPSHGMCQSPTQKTFCMIFWSQVHYTALVSAQWRIFINQPYNLFLVLDSKNFSSIARGFIKWWLHGSKWVVLKTRGKMIHEN